MGLPSDWQIDKQKIADRGQYLLETGKWSDCKFIVGQEPYQQILMGHKLFLAMSSPVFEAMFFGGIAEKNDPIPIRDVQPEAFKALLGYIYTDRVQLGSFELACELCYCAKKYMLPGLVEECTKYLWSDLCPKKACRAYEFAKLFEEPVLMDRCLQIICTKTSSVLTEPSWEEVDLATLLTVLDQENLEIQSELELFTAVERWAKAECVRKSLDPSDGKCLKSTIGNALSKIRFLSLEPQEFAEGPGRSPLLIQDEAFAILMNILCTANKAPMPEGFSTETQSRAKLMNSQCMTGQFSVFNNFDPFRVPKSTRDRRGSIMGTPAVPQRVSGFSSIGTELSSFLRTSSPVNNSQFLVADGGVREGLRYCCVRSVTEETDCLNTNVLDCSVTFSVDKNICVLGVQVPTQIPGPANGIKVSHVVDSSYTEVLYAHLLDSDDTRLTYTHFTTKVNIGTLVEITFNRPVYIQKNKIYRVGVVFNKVGYYPVGVCTQNTSSDSVFFTFGVGKRADNVRDDLIRGIVFSYH